ncbi:MAG TPA: DUF4166 domain-containing protein [Allosphingosinicella sp.]|nr:DUF4166 domain-containing protein [Allosphingosinicella sp.]
MQRFEAKVIPFPPRPVPRPAPADVADLRFRTLVGEADWARLPVAVRARFGRHIGEGRSILYAGEVVECRMSRCGRLLAEALRPIGAPLPLSREAFVPASVSVTEDPASGGQFWTRIYGRPPSTSLRTSFPQVIRSAKRFRGPTGLEEYIGCGIGIALRVAVEDGALHFLSDHYFVRIGRLRLRLPALLTPGRMKVSHVDCGHGWFAFVLRLDHPWLGALVRQTALFRERVAAEEAL